jgi:hypothetical protein
MFQTQCDDRCSPGEYMMGSEIVIVGGGPIGCWTAIQAKRRNPELDVTIYERFENYQRDHIMTIRRKSLTHCQPAGKEQKDFMLRLFSFQSTCSELCSLSKPSKFTSDFRFPRLLDIRTIDFGCVAGSNGQPATISRSRTKPMITAPSGIGSTARSTPSTWAHRPSTATASSSCTISM